MDCFSLGIDLLKSLMPIPLRSPVKISNAAGLQRRLYRRHTKFKTPAVMNSKSKKWAMQEEIEGCVVWMGFNA
jgi:hypothetical protein